jgi:site-specific recombinase XerD
VAALHQRYLKWKGLDLKIPRLKEEQMVVATLTPEQIKMLISCKPRGTNETRCYAAALLNLDSGLCISEALGLQMEHCGLDNLVAKVRGKGGKHWLVPLSTDMRKVLFRYSNCALHHRSCDCSEGRVFA